MTRFIRTHSCGQLRMADCAASVTICGWVDRRRDHGDLTFLDIRDRSGIVQVVTAQDQQLAAHTISQEVRAEYVVSVTGTVVARSAQTRNSELPTGDIEIQAQSITILNRCKTLPFPLHSTDEVDEETRLSYRYLDLRRPEVHERFKIRHQVILAMRKFLDSLGFYELETPILTKNTAEGAREFLVPSRVHKGQFYALPQSPQIYKQLLMAGGMERYFQIARCFRDEDLRADRQPEFTQLDLEMSFVNEQDIQDSIEQLLAHVLQEVFGYTLQLPLMRMPYDTAMGKYGSDKPDIRFDLPIHDVTSVFADTQLAFLKNVIASNGRIGALCTHGKTFTRSELETWVTTALKNGAQGLVWIRYNQGAIEAPIAKFLPADFAARIQQHIPEFTEGSTLFLIAGQYASAWTQLGRLRIQLAHALDMIPQDTLSFHWVVDFPLLEYDADKKTWSSVHHPFTSPQAGWEQQQPGDMKARAYDIVLNGIELGGGSIRIHTPEVQQKIFDFLGFNSELMRQHFGFLLQAQEYGFPPHGGIALGLDRFIMLMLKCASIRDVIAFPKTQTGADPLLHAPTPVEPSKLAEYELKHVPVTKPGA